MLQPDTTIAVLQAPAAAPGTAAFESAMLGADKLPVVLGVVLLVWAGLLWILFRTDRRLARVERRLAEAEAGGASRL